MEKNISRKIWVLAMSGVLAMSALTGCGEEETIVKRVKNDNTATEESKIEQADSDENDKESSADEEVAEVDGWTAFEDNVTLTIPVYDRGVEGVPAIGENYWESWVQENFGDKYNITMEYVPITRSDVMNSYDLLMAQDNLPTILMEYDYPKLAQWAEEGYLTTYSLEDFAEVAPTYYERMVELEQIPYTELDGECYFALAERPYHDTTYTWVTFYRQDWAKQVGYDEYPDSWAEQVDMLTKIKEEGICDYPLGGAMITSAVLDKNYQFRTYPMDEEEWAIYGDYNIAAMGYDGHKAFLKRENEKYNLGFISPNYYEIDEEAAKNKFINGQCFEYTGYIATDMEWLTALYENEPDADLAVKIDKAPDPEGGTVPAYRANNPFGMMIGFSSMASEDEIKAAWMYMEWMTLEDNLKAMQWGIEDEHYTSDENGLPVAIADYSGDKVQGYNNNKDYWCVTIEAKQSGSIEDIIAASSPAGLPEDFTQDIIDYYYTQVEFADQGYAVVDCNYAVVIESATANQASLDELYISIRDELTMCKPEEFDEKYEKAVKKYNEAGYQDILDEKLAAYKAGKSTKLQ